MWEPSPTGAPMASPQGAAGHRGPTQAQLTYAKTLLELALLLLAVPWLVMRFLRNPSKTIRDAGEHHL